MCACARAIDESEREGRKGWRTCTLVAAVTRRVAGAPRDLQSPRAAAEGRGKYQRKYHEYRVARLAPNFSPKNRSIFLPSSSFESYSPSFPSLEGKRDRDRQRERGRITLDRKREKEKKKFGTEPSIRVRSC